MTTIKLYTDLEQSKKLAEILPIESADMVWSSVCYEGIPSNGDEKLINVYLDPETNHFYFAELYEEFLYDNNDIKEYPSIPCWSLTALLNLIPTPTLARLDDKEDGGWYCNTIKFGEDYFSYDGNYHDNPIDACIEVIKWLINNKHIKL